MNTLLSNQNCEFVNSHMFHLFGFAKSDNKPCRVAIQNLHPELTLRVLSISFEQAKGLELASLEKNVNVPKTTYSWDTLQGPVLNIKPHEVKYSPFSVLCAEAPIHIVGWWLNPDKQNNKPDLDLKKSTLDFVQVCLTDQIGKVYEDNRVDPHGIDCPFCFVEP